MIQGAQDIPQILILRILGCYEGAIMKEKNKD